MLLIAKPEWKEFQERIIKQKGIRTWYLRNSQLIQIANDAEVRRFTVRKACFGEKASGVASQVRPECSAT